MIQLRTVHTPNLEDISAIDVSESGDRRYQFIDGQLQIIEQTWQRDHWDAEAWPRRVANWAEKLKPDLYVAAYADAQMVGIAGLRYQLTPTMAQLTSLYIDLNHRRQGVAHHLVQEVFRLSEEYGAQTIYVSSKPSIPAVGFYMRQGFAVTSEPDSHLFALQPLDIHMIKLFTSDSVKEAA